MWIADQEFFTFTPQSLPEDLNKIICKLICLNSTANPEFQLIKGKLRTEVSGSLTECALLELAYRLGYDYREHRKKGDLI